MALNDKVWENALKSKLDKGLKDIFKEMHSKEEENIKDDKWFAEELAALISSAVASTGTDQIKTAAVPAGSYVDVVTGQAVGTLKMTPVNVV
jgi:hypothetical protein